MSNDTSCEISGGLTLLIYPYIWIASMFWALALAYKNIWVSAFLLLFGITVVVINLWHFYDAYSFLRNAVPK